MYGSIGRSALVKREMATNQAIAWGIPRADILPEFLFLMVRHHEKDLDALGRGATQRNINRKIIKSFPVLIPPLDEQRRIVDLIGAMDDTITAAESKLHALEHLLSAAREALIGAPGPKRPFAEVAKLQRGFDLPVHSRRDGDVVVMSSSGPHGTHDVAQARGPGVVTGRSGTIGIVHYVEKDFWPLNTTLWVRDFKGNSPKYIRYLLQTMRLVNHAGGSTVPSLNRNVLDGVLVYAPTRKEQDDIADLLESIEETSGTCLTAVARLRDLRSNLLTALLSGEHEIPESYDAVMGELVKTLV